MSVLDNFPIWAVYVGLVVMVLIAAEVGFRIGIWMQDRSDKPGESKMTGAVVGGMLGLMAFLMAFTIGIVISQQGERKAMVVEEANAIGTAWLRAGFLEEPDSVGCPAAAAGIHRDSHRGRQRSVAVSTPVRRVPRRSTMSCGRSWRTTFAGAMSQPSWV